MAKEIGRGQGVEPDIELGNLEDYPLPENYYDVVMASSVFEHVEDWRMGVHKVYRTLKPGGILYFESTNKFSFTSGEYSLIPLYGWMPNWLRYSLRKMIHGKDIMKLGSTSISSLPGAFERVRESRVQPGPRPDPDG